MIIPSKNRDCELKMLITELLSIALFILFFATLDYLSLWQPQLNYLLQLKQTAKQLQSNVIKKQAQLAAEKTTHAKLMQWQKKNPDFYLQVSTITTPNQQFSLLTHLIQGAHFKILQIAKINTLENSKKDCQLSIKSNGQFADLLILIDDLKNFVIPFQLSQLAINQQQYKMMFVVRDCHD